MARRRRSRGAAGPADLRCGDMLALRIGRMSPVHFDPDSVAAAVNSAQGTASTPWYAGMIQSLFGSLATLFLAVAGWFGARAWTEKRKKPSQPTTPASGLRTHDEVAEAVTDAKLEMRIFTLERDHITFWKRYDDQEKIIDDLRLQVKSLPDRLETAASERRIIDAIQSVRKDTQDWRDAHIRDFHHGKPAQ